MNGAKIWYVHLLSHTEFDRLRYATFIPSLFSAWASWSKLQIWLFCSLPAFAASNFCSNLLIFAWSNWPYKNILLHSAPWPSKKGVKIKSLLLRARFPSSLHACKSIEQWVPLAIQPRAKPSQPSWLKSSYQRCNAFYLYIFRFLIMAKYCSWFSDILI